MKKLFAAIIIIQFITIQTHSESSTLIQEIITQNIYSVGDYGLIIIRASSNITVDSIQPVDKYSHYEFKISNYTFLQGSEYIVVINGTIQSKKEGAPGGFICEPALLNITVKNTSSDLIEYRLVLLTVCSSNFQYINDTINNINESINNIREIITAPRLIEVAALALSIVSIGLLSILLIMFKKTMREEMVFGL
jgi:hypothetical protein